MAARPLSLVAPDWWDYTTLDDVIISDPAGSDRAMPESQRPRSDLRTCDHQNPANAASQAPSRICSQAWWIATSEEEHMVSIGMLGPDRSRKNDSRLAIELNEVRGYQRPAATGSWAPRHRYSR